MRTLEITGATPGLAEIVETLQDEPLALLRDGQPVAVLLPVEGSDLETVSLSLNPKFLAILERSARSQYEEGSIPAVEVWRRLGVESPAPNAATGGKKVRGKRR